MSNAQAIAAAAWRRDVAIYLPVRRQVRRLITLGCKAGKPWDAATTVGEVSRASRTDPAEVVRVIRACGYLMEVRELPGRPVEEWIVWEDGE